MERLRYPPCIINPVTEMPYKRHKWEIPAGVNGITRQTRKGPVVYYRIRCKRCGYNDPNPPTY